jgi:hypothetical protein
MPSAGPLIGVVRRNPRDIAPPPAESHASPYSFLQMRGPTTGDMANATKQRRACGTGADAA